MNIDILGISELKWTSEEIKREDYTKLSRIKYTKIKPQVKFIYSTHEYILPENPDSLKSFKDKHYYCKES